MMDQPRLRPPKPGMASPEMINDWLLPRSRFARDMGVEVIACADGFAELRIPYKEELTQHHGFLHGGVICAMIDTVSSWAAASLVGDVLTADMHTNFLSPGRGERFVAKAQVVKETRRMVVVRADVAAERGDQIVLIATGMVTMLRIDAPTL